MDISGDFMGKLEGKVASMPARHLRRAIATLVVVTPLWLLSGCIPALGPRPEPKPVAAYRSEQSFTAAEGSWPEQDWWHAYDDPQLDRLIGDALDGSPDLRIAQTRLLQAEAIAKQASAALLPRVDAQGSASELRQTLNQGFPESFQSFLPHGWHSRGALTANFDYELDLFGKNRAEFAAATSEVDAARIDAAAARLSLSTAIAESYARFVELSADQGAAKEALRIRRESTALVISRHEQQLENGGEVSQAKARVDAAQADLDVIDGQLARQRNLIAALIGEGPDRGLEIAVPAGPQLRAFGVPNDLAAGLLGRRPDVVAARLRVEAAAQRIEVARADFYPNINLAGFIGQQSLPISNLFSAQSIVGQVGPAISLPLFDGGRREAAYRGTYARYDEAVADYDKTLTAVLREVADALADARELASELAHSRAALAHSEDAHRIATLRYRGGLSRYLEVLTAEDTEVAEKRRAATLEARAFTVDIALVSAVGGGFVDPSSPLAFNRRP
jgi:NodT family efflux transporter outer membrane factor (OMF) lipoprotein